MLVELLMSLSISSFPIFPAVPQNAAPEFSPPSLSSASYGHFPYPEAMESELTKVPGTSEKLRPSAAIAFLQMQSAARREGITLRLISGFRSRQTQQHLFYGIARQRGISLAERAKYSAPPGYSEHHTGYALDLNSLNPSFKHTKAFAWLQKNAPLYGFEMSFPAGNSQGVNEEPWHWRYVGEPTARQIFDPARIQNLESRH